MPANNPLPDSQVFQAYGIHLLKPGHSLVKQLKQHFKPSIHGHKTWNSSFLLMDYLLHSGVIHHSQQALELGCGWGPASIFCASQNGCKVTAVDSDSQVFPFLDVQATLNSVEVRTREARFEDLSTTDLAAFDLLFGTDVCFWDELEEIHLALIERALKAGVSNIVYADPGRGPFLSLAGQCETRFNARHLEWYATEPKHFEGHILHISQR